MPLKNQETFAWIARRLKNGADDDLLDWSRDEVEAALSDELPAAFIEAALAILEERRRLVAQAQAGSGVLVRP